MLHGTVEINHVVVGEWRASRATTAGDFATYDCVLEYRDEQGYPCRAEWTLHGHGVKNGAISLAARVLTEGLARAARVRAE